jgi:metallo-beta-lactamase class B
MLPSARTEWGGLSLKTLVRVLGLVTSLVIALPALAAQAEDYSRSDAGNMKQFPPFRIVGNLYYVGSYNQSSYLITTPQGLILINSGYEASVPLIRKSVEDLGFHFSDIKLLLISHAHGDHDAGSAAVIKATGAKYHVMDADVAVVQSGGRVGTERGTLDGQKYPPTHVDRVLHDGDTDKLGDVVLTAHLTPGHTKGCTTWTFDEKQDGRVLHVVIIGGTAVNPGVQLIGNAAYPQIVADFRHTFAVLQALPADIYLGAHSWYFDLQAKYDKLKAGDQNAFVDPEGYKAYVAARAKGFDRDLNKQMAESNQPASK